MQSRQPYVSQNRIMRTTVDNPDALYRRLKARAASEGSSAKALILRGVAVPQMQPQTKFVEREGEAKTIENGHPSKGSWPRCPNSRYARRTSSTSDKRRSLCAQDPDRVESQHAPRRHIRRTKRDDGQPARRPQERHRLEWNNPVERAGHHRS